MSDGDRPGDPDAHDPSQIVATVGRDPVDERDHVFAVSDDVVAALPARVDYGEYARYVQTTWHQRGLECTGFALAAIANFIFRKQLDDPDLPSVSRRMLYEMAQLHDDADHREGSTPRGALKGWNKVGVACDDLWPYDPADEDGRVHGGLTLARVLDARRRPLLRYRSIPDGSKDVLRAALAEGRPVFASSDTHGGWYRLFLGSVEPEIRRAAHDKPAGDHAFVIVGYDDDRQGFWVHNSWGCEWGREGYALLPYEEWERTWSSAWVVDARTETGDDTVAEDASPRLPSEESATETYRDMWPHLVVVRDDGRLAAAGRYEMDAGSVRTLLFLFQEHAIAAGVEHRRLAVFADGGYFATAATIERLRPMRDRLMQADIYPIFVVWETAWFVDMAQELRVSLRRRGEQLGGVGSSDPTPDIGAALVVPGSAFPHAWDLLRERSRLACLPDHGGVRHLAEAIAFKRNQKPFDVHLVSHGVGDHLLAEFAAVLPTPVASVTVVASAGPLSTLDDVYGPMLDDGWMRHLSVVDLDDDSERADRFGPLSGSLLDVVSTMPDAGRPSRSNTGAVDVGSDPPPAGRPLLGLRRHLERHPVTERLVQAGLMSVDTVSRSRHVDVAFVPSVIEQMVERMLRYETATSARRRGADPPRDPLERAAAIRRASETSE